jgi:hypothetical protein
MEAASGSAPRSKTAVNALETVGGAAGVLADTGACGNKTPTESLPPKPAP